MLCKPILLKKYFHYLLTILPKKLSGCVMKMVNWFLMKSGKELKTKTWCSVIDRNVLFNIGRVEALEEKINLFLRMEKSKLDGTSLICFVKEYT